MCGLAGFKNTKNENHDWQDCLARMGEAIRHRGPDDQGQWFDPEKGLGFSHRRLSIVDLSRHGHQPMASNSGRFVIAYNGEVYNFQELRRELDETGDPILWKGHSDTEVILAAIERWGVEQAVQRFIGMFAFSLWDKRECALHLVRDRLGIKPLYYGWQGNAFLFGSELKALKQHPAFQGEINRGALALFLRHGYINFPYSIYQGIYKLLPGTILTIKEFDPGLNLEPQPYWSARTVAETGTANPFMGTEQEAVAELDSLLRDAIKHRMIADVPLGAFLSGGIDSSTVVALMQAQSTRPIKTFSIGFNEEHFNEAEHAKAVANHLGTDHTELYVTSKEAMNVIPRLPALYDEPFSDSSQIPTFLVSELARREVTVSLSGDGGDELFYGYTRYFIARDLWRIISRIPKWSRRSLAACISSVHPRILDYGLGWMAPLMTKYGSARRIGEKLHKLAKVLPTQSSLALYLRLVSHWKDPLKIVKQAPELSTVFSSNDFCGHLAHYPEQMMLLDTVTYLPCDILTKVDRASMGVSLEARVPLLDHRVVEFAWRIPHSMKSRNGKGKWLLRQVLDQYVPKELVERPKMGFGVPIDQWLRGPLRDWAEHLLDSQKIHNEGYFNPEPIRDHWSDHLSGKHNRQYTLWNVLMFQAWLEKEAKK